MKLDQQVSLYMFLGLIWNYLNSQICLSAITKLYKQNACETSSNVSELNYKMYKLTVYRGCNLKCTTK